MPAVILEMQEYLTNHYAERLTLDNLSEKFSVSKYHLQRLFKKYVGQSPNEYLASQRLNHAKELLRSTDLPVGEIAYRIGVENTSYFISQFRTQERITPQKYRETWPNR